MRYALPDIFRFFSISLIVFYHLRLEVDASVADPFFKIGDYISLNLGNLAVILFIIISGVVLELKYGKRQYKYTRFLFKRFKRIYSVYFLCLLFAVVIYFSVSRDILSLGSYYFGKIGSIDIFCSLFGTCNYFLRMGGPFIASSWFIGLIVALYFIFPFLSKKFKKNPHLTLIILLTFTLILHATEANTPVLSRFFIRLSPLFNIFWFGLGIYLVKVLSSNVWSALDKYQTFSKIIGFAGLISFPVFLIHHPLLFIFNALRDSQASFYFSISAYLLVTVFISYLVLKLAEKIFGQKE